MKDQMTSIDVDLEELLHFLFPKSIQYPLVAGRLFAYGNYGPLDSSNNLRSGFQRSHKVQEYELEYMCIQSDREDVINIFAHDFKELSSSEQSMIISQADSRMTTAKGKALLPALNKEDVMEILQDVPRDMNGKLSFHEMQKAIAMFRQKRIKDFKLVYPPLPRTHVPSSSSHAKYSSIINGTKNNLITKTSRRNLDNVGPASMFKFMEGKSNAEVTQQVAKNLSKHAFKVTSVGEGDERSSISNVQLLREIHPTLLNGQNQIGIKNWSETCNLKNVGMGSMVQAAASRTTWNRKHTNY